MSQAIPLLVLIVAALLAFAAGAAIARRRGYLEQNEVIVRCRKGHFFRTQWMPPFSLRLLHFGWGRIQRCPVDDHLTVVRRVPEGLLSPRDKEAARRVHDRFLGRRKAGPRPLGWSAAGGLRNGGRRMPGAFSWLALRWLVYQDAATS